MQAQHSSSIIMDAHSVRRTEAQRSKTDFQEMAENADARGKGKADDRRMRDGI